MSRDVTTPLSGTFCHPSAWPSYDQHVHQIWSLYVYSLRRYERQWKMQKLEWFGRLGLGVTQGHQQHSHSIEHIRLIFDFNRNYVSILYRFRVIVHFPSKVANFNLPHLQLSPPYGWSCWISPWSLASKAEESWGYCAALFAWSYV